MWGGQARGYLSSLGKGLGDPAVPAAVAGGDQVGHAAALQEGGCGHLALAEDPGEGDHFHESQADDSSFGVVPAAETVAEPGSHRYDVLRRRQGRQDAVTHALRMRMWGRSGARPGHSPWLCSWTMSDRDERRDPFQDRSPDLGSVGGSSGRARAPKRER